MRDAGQNWNSELESGIQSIGVNIAGKGELIVGGDLTIEGRFLGKLQVKGCLTVGRDAVVIGDLNVTNLELHGRINGSVKVANKAVFHSGSFLSGSVSASLGEMMEGSHISGERRFERSLDKEAPEVKTQPVVDFYQESPMPWHQVF
jgi:cytoskeletal protein CcmA (bactofilin family)